MAVDFEKEMAGIVGLVPPDITLAPETAPIAMGAWEEVDQDYGPESDDPRLFHDAPHSIGGAYRGVELANKLRPFIPPVYQDRIYDLIIVSQSVHDRHLDHGPDNEADSAEFGVRKIEEADGALNTSFTKQRLWHGVMATLVIIEADGRVVQPNMQTGARDPLKFIAGFSDKNGIAMEGDERMWSDAPNLYYEKTPTAEQTIEGLIAFCSRGQAQFLRQGLNDPVIKSAITYHFGDTAPAVYKIMFDAFHDNIAEAHAQATQLSKRPDLQHALGHLARTVNRSHFGPLAVRLVRRMVKRNPTDPAAS